MLKLTIAALTAFALIAIPPVAEAKGKGAKKPAATKAVKNWPSKPPKGTK